MTADCACIDEQSTVLEAARKMKELDVGALPICGEDNRLKGMITDRDIVVRVLANGADPGGMKVRELAEGTPVFVYADQSTDEAVKLMADNAVRRLPVIDGAPQSGRAGQPGRSRAEAEARESRRNARGRFELSGPCLPPGSCRRMGGGAAAT